MEVAGAPRDSAGSGATEEAVTRRLLVPREGRLRRLESEKPLLLAPGRRASHHVLPDLRAIRGETAETPRRPGLA